MESSRDIDWDAALNEFMERYGFSPEDDAVAKALAARLVKSATGVDPVIFPEAAEHKVADITNEKTRLFLEAALRRLGIPIPNHPPVVRTLSGPERVGTGQEVELAAEASDPDGDPLEYNWSCSGGTIAGSGPTVTWRAPNWAGHYSITVTVADQRGGVAEEAIDIEVRRTFDPVPLVIAGAIAVGILIVLTLIQR